MDFIKAVSIIIAGILAFAVTDRLMAVAPDWQLGINSVFVGHHLCARRKGLGEDRLDRLLLDIGQQLEHDLAATLDHPEDGRLLFRKRAASARPSIGGGVRGGLFFHGFGLAFVARDEIDLVAFDDAFELRFGLAFDDAGAQLDSHLVDVIFVQTEFLRDLLIGQIESEQIETDDAFAQRLMMVREDRLGQIIKVTLAGFAMIALSRSLTQVPPATFDVFGLTPDTVDTFRPTHLSDSFVALCIVYQVIDLEHTGSMLDSNSLSKSLGTEQ
jgi:uncharacterized protein YciU (UPF0263 family)